jgi:hypothetical protein
VVIKTIRKEYVCGDCDRSFVNPEGGYVGQVVFLCRNCRDRFERRLGFKTMKRVCDTQIRNDPSRLDIMYVNSLPRVLRVEALSSYHDYLLKNRRRRNARMPDARKRWLVEKEDLSGGDF